jgi:hypothetical protein
VTIADEPNMKTIAKAVVPGLTKAQNSIQIGVLIAVSIITVWTLYMVPSWQVPGDPFLLAAVVGAVTVACLWLARCQQPEVAQWLRHRILFADVVGWLNKDNISTEVATAYYRGGYNSFRISRRRDWTSAHDG